MRYFIFLSFVFVFHLNASAQSSVDRTLLPVKVNAHTSVKNQSNTSTCWSFSTTSLIESQAMRQGLGEFDLSEMFIVRNIYLEKARNYILRQGAAQFGSGGLGHDVINCVAKYGIVPENVYSGLLLGSRYHDHSQLDEKLKTYLDSLLEKRPIPANWMDAFQNILNDHLGKPPESFIYQEKVYTPKSFAKEVLRFKRDDYIFISSFTHVPFYSSFIIQIPDNYANESYYNIPLNEMISLTDETIQKGYSLMWNADISNANFRHKDGFAMLWKEGNVKTEISPDDEEALYDQLIRQQLFENLTTQDDHLMHIVGLEKSKKGKKFYTVKNSWGEKGAFKGYVKVSEAYFAINTITLIVPKAALSASLRTKLKLN